jgi:hypothetical protein
VGRDSATIRKTMLYRGEALGKGDIDGFVADAADYAQVGIDGLIVVPPGDRPAAWIAEVCAPAVPRLAELPTG